MSGDGFQHPFKSWAACYRPARANARYLTRPCPSARSAIRGLQVVVRRPRKASAQVRMALEWTLSTVNHSLNRARCGIKWRTIHPQLASGESDAGTNGIAAISKSRHRQCDGAKTAGPEYLPRPVFPLAEARQSTPADKAAGGAGGLAKI